MKPTNARDMWTRIETQFAKNSAEMWRTKSITKRKMSENKVASDNFDNVELHVHSHN